MAINIITPAVNAQTSPAVVRNCRSLTFYAGARGQGNSTIIPNTTAGANAPLNTGTADSVKMSNSAAVYNRTSATAVRDGHNYSVVFNMIDGVLHNIQLNEAGTANVVTYS